jgi:hypothetical protein
VVWGKSSMESEPRREREKKKNRHFSSSGRRSQLEDGFSSWRSVFRTADVDQKSSRLFEILLDSLLSNQSTAGKYGSEIGKGVG